MTTHFFKLTILSLLCYGMVAQGAGPAVIAKTDRQLWQAPVNSPELFDKASRANILIYALSLQETQALSDAEIKTAFKIKTVNRASITKWFNKELALSLHNYQNAAKSCANEDWTCVTAIRSTADLVTQAKIWQTKIPATLSAWRDNLTQFTRTYTAEQMRLAALFPSVSSEIDSFNDQEWNGDDFADRQFLLSFDDGPTKPQDNTDTLLTLLAARQKSAVFFVLGDALQNRINTTDVNTIATLYKGQCVAMHGWEHQSHATWANWQESIKRTQRLIINTLAHKNAQTAGSFLPLFRPPYGQRRADSGAFFKQQNLHVLLWNLDSQDWNNQVEGEDIPDRMLTLMLIKRHGVLLFHDITPKANIALPILFNELDQAVEWQDCHQLAMR